MTTTLTKAVTDYFELWDRCGGSTAIAAEEFAAARQVMRDALGEPQSPSARWRHKERGSTYAEIGRGRFQAFESCHDMESVVIYQSETDGELWVRPTIEFEDGRFENLSAPNPSLVYQEVVWLREVDAGTDNACWVISNRIYPDAVPFFMGSAYAVLRLTAQADAPGAPSDRQFNADLRDDAQPQSPAEPPIALMQRVWANLYYNEEDAGNTFQQTLNEVVDWLAARNALPGDAPDSRPVRPTASEDSSQIQTTQGE